MPRALICEKNGDPTLPVGHGVLKVVEGYELPVLKPGHVRVAVTAASVNYAGAWNNNAKVADDVGLSKLCCIP